MGRDLCTWDYLKLDWAPSLVEPPGRDGCTQPPLPAAAGEDLKNQPSRLNNPAGGISSTKERHQEECLKGSIVNSSQGDKVHWVPGPYFTEAIKAGSSESDATRGNSGLCPALAQTQNCCLHQAGESWHFYTDCLPPSEINNYLMRNYTWLEINWGRPRQETSQQGEHSHNFPRRLNRASQERPRGPTLPITTEAPSRQVKEIKTVLPKVGPPTLGPCTDKKKQRRIRREVRRWTPTIEMNYILFFLRTCVFLSSFFLFT